MPGSSHKPCSTKPALRLGLRLGLWAGWLLMQTAVSLAQSVTLFSTASADKPPPPWRVLGFPTGNKPISQFDIATLDGERVLRVVADKSYGQLQHDLPNLTLGTGSLLRWRWRLEQPLRDADLHQKKGDDSPLKVCVLFDMPAKNLGLFERGFLSAARSMSKENLPAATLCYVWDHKLPVGTELPNAYTKRVRYVVMNSGDSQLKTWLSHERDIAADFMRAFGSETDTLPPLMGLAVGADEIGRAHV